VRRYWKGDGGQLSDLGYRLTGSSDLYKHDGRRPYASINFITAHDGFTLNDLVSYNDKHNEANGENNQDGTNDNNSWNMGAEGETQDETICYARQRQMRNLLATLMFSQGVPMISGGDEIGRSQNGNNNAYCQDNPISWYDWTATPEKEALVSFTCRLIEMRKNHPNLRRRKFFQDRTIHHSNDIAWYGTNGQELNDDAWNSGWMRTLGMMLNGQTLDITDELGNPVVDDTFLLLINAHHEAVSFVLPRTPAGGRWRVVLNTNDLANPFKTAPTRTRVKLEGRSLVMLCERKAKENILP
jgi:glycogen operon protein